MNKQIAEGYKYDANGKREGKIYYKKLPKTETSIRDVPMADHTEECLLELKRRYIQANYPQSRSTPGNIRAPEFLTAV